MSTVPTAREVWQRSVDAALRGDIAAQTDFYHPDAVLEFPFLMGGHPNRFEGRERIGAFFAAMQAGVPGTDTVIDREKSRLTLHETLDPEVVIAEIELAMSVGGSVMNSRYVHVIRVRDGLIVSLRDYFAGGVAAIVTGVMDAMAPAPAQ